MGDPPSLPKSRSFCSTLGALEDPTHWLTVGGGMERAVGQPWNENRHGKAALLAVCRTSTKLILGDAWEHLEEAVENPSSLCVQPNTRVRVPSRFRRVQLFATLWTSAHQAPLSMGFPRHKYWSKLSCPPPGDLPNLGIELKSLMSPSTTWEVQPNIYATG